MAGGLRPSRWPCSDQPDPTSHNTVGETEACRGWGLAPGPTGTLPPLPVSPPTSPFLPPEAPTHHPVNQLSHARWLLASLSSGSGVCPGVSQKVTDSWDGSKGKPRSVTLPTQPQMAESPRGPGGSGGPWPLSTTSVTVTLAAAGMKRLLC